MDQEEQPFRIKPMRKLLRNDALASEQIAEPQEPVDLVPVPATPARLAPETLPPDENFTDYGEMDSPARVKHVRSPLRAEDLHKLMERHRRSEGRDDGDGTLPKRTGRGRNFFSSRRHGRDRVFRFLVLPAMALVVVYVLVFILKPRPPALDADRPASAARTTPRFESEEVRQLTLSGRAAIRSRDFSKAEALFREIVAKNPDDATAWNNLGYCLLSLGRMKEAIEPLSQAVKLNPLAAAPLVNRSLCYRSTDRAIEGMEDIRQAVRLSPSDSLAANFLLLARAQAGERDAVNVDIAANRKLNIPNLVPQWIGAAAGLAAGDGDLPGAEADLGRARPLLSRKAMGILLADPAFAAHRQKFMELTGLSGPGKIEPHTDTPEAE